MTITALNKNRLAERKYLLKIMDCIRYLALQGIAFRGDDGNDNLTQLFKLLNKNDVSILKRLYKDAKLDSGQHKYLHNDIQNKLIDLMTKQILSKKRELIRSSKLFAMMTDEYTHISNKELLSMCFRWIDEALKVHEDFLENKSGVSVNIAAEQPKALATHCQGHSLNLGIKTTVTNSEQIKDVSFFYYYIYLVRFPTSYERAQNTRLHH